MEPLKKLLLLSVLSATVADFTANCPEKCKCSWVRGNTQAVCSNANFQELPKALSAEIQILDFSNNCLKKINQNAFEDVQLINLKKLFLGNCELETIHKNAFRGLTIMIAIDLSRNNLKELHPETFKETTNIRWILLNDNQLETLEDGLFNSLQFLQTVDLSNNKVKYIGVKTFVNVPELNNLKLENNLLESVDVKTFNTLNALTSLDIQENPWKCDCRIRLLRNWVMSSHLSMGPVACVEPAKLRGKIWTELESSDFACQPSILYPNSSMTIETHNSNTTLSCQVNGDPLPEVRWVVHSQIIDNSYKIQGESKYYLSERNDETSKWINLTILSPGKNYSGDYICVAKNPAGTMERSVRLVIDTPPIPL